MANGDITTYLTWDEIRALRSMPEFQAALAAIKAEDAAKAEELDRASRERSLNEATLMVPRHLQPHRQPGYKFGLPESEQ